MPYIKRTTEAGKTIEVEYYYSSVYNRGTAKRSKKTKPTSKQQREINRKQAERRLRLLMNNNFGYGDYHVVLDYVRKKGQPEQTKEEMRKDAQVFLRECRKQYRLQGKELKYIHVMEIGKRGSRHHHLVMNRIDPKILQKAWYKAYGGHNRVKIFPLDDSGQYADLASYFIKYSDKHLHDEQGQRLQGKRWSASRNLVMPESKREIVTHRKWFRCEAKPKKGYYIDQERTERGINSPEYYGYGFFRFTMVRLE